LVVGVFLLYSVFSSSSSSRLFFLLFFFLLLLRPPPPSTLFPYTTLFRSTIYNGNSRRYIDGSCINRTDIECSNRANAWFRWLSSRCSNNWLFCTNDWFRCFKLSRKRYWWIFRTRNWNFDVTSG